MKTTPSIEKKGILYKLTSWVEQYALTLRGALLFIFLAILDTGFKVSASLYQTAEDKSGFIVYTFGSCLMASAVALIITGISATKCNYSSKDHIDAKELEKQLVEVLDKLNSTLERIESESANKTERTSSITGFIKYHINQK